MQELQHGHPIRRDYERSPAEADALDGDLSVAQQLGGDLRREEPACSELLYVSLALVMIATDFPTHATRHALFANAVRLEVKP
jgi:hypothetical protein